MVNAAEYYSNMPESGNVSARKESNLLPLIVALVLLSIALYFVL